MLVHYDRIPKAEEPDTYLEKGLAAGRMAAARVKGIADKELLTKAREKDRIRAVQTAIVTPLAKLHDAYPSFDQLHEFSRQLFALDMEIGRVRQALAGVQQAGVTITRLAREHTTYLSRARDRERVQKVRDAFLGRVASVLRQTGKHLHVLNDARAVFRQLPVLDGELFTVCIAGFPNVGKSTLLKRLTSAKPEIAPYAFTTKGLNAGYFEYLYNRVQCVDTPGTLHRDRMNAVERKADVAIRYLAHVIVYVFDPTETSYPLADQRQLHAHLRTLDKDVLVYVSKTDIADPAVVAQLVDEYDACTDAEALRTAIVKKFRAWV